VAAKASAYWRHGGIIISGSMAYGGMAWHKAYIRHGEKRCKQRLSVAHRGEKA